MLDAPLRICPTPPAHSGTTDRSYKWKVPLLGRVRYHDPNESALGGSQRSSWQRHPQNHEGTGEPVQESFWGYHSVYAKPQPVESRSWSMLECALQLVLGRSERASRSPGEELYSKFGHLPPVSTLRPPLPHLTSLSAPIPHLYHCLYHPPHLPLSTEASTLPYISLTSLLSACLFSSSASPLGNTYGSVGDNGSY